MKKMKTKPIGHPVPAPRKGWAWVRGQVRKTDRFLGYDGGTVACSSCDCGHSDGPRIWHDEGAERFTVSGYIRRLRK
jgi:hypothetical protein